MGERLDSWKDIAAYLGREVRTAQRWALDRHLPVHRLPGGGRPRVFSLKSEIDAWMKAGEHDSRQAAASVAVLPFLNLAGGVDDRYFADGLADDVINALVRIPGLRVTARTSSFMFDARGYDVREVGRKLGAAWLVEGSVQRAGDRIRVSAQLVNTGDGYHAWSENYDRRLTDRFVIQDEIARSIAQALQVKLAIATPSRRPTEDPAAYDLWLRGRSLSQRYTPDAIREACACYEAAIARDPRFARPYFGLAEIAFHGLMFGVVDAQDAGARARKAVDRSLELEDSFGDAHALSGTLLGLLDYDWPGAEAAFRRAFELSPGSAAILIQHAWYYLVPRMRVAEALDQARQAVELDPLSPFARGQFGLILMVARQYERAVGECEAALKLAPEFWFLRWFYGSALLFDGRLVRGFEEARKVYDQIHKPLVVGAMSLMYGLFQRKNKARQLLAELQETSRTANVPPMAFAYAYLGLGDDRVFEWLDRAIDARDPTATHLPSMPIFDGIRDDPRFQALLARMNLG